MTGTRYVFADFEDMVWVPRKRLSKKMMDIGDETDAPGMGSGHDKDLIYLDKG